MNVSQTEKHGTNELASWSYFGKGGTIVILTEQGQAKVMEEFSLMLSKCSPAKRYQDDAYKAPEQVMHWDNLYLKMLYELVMYGRFEVRLFMDMFERAYGRQSIHLGEQFMRLWMFLDVRFDLD